MLSSALLFLHCFLRQRNVFNCLLSLRGFSQWPKVPGPPSREPLWERVRARPAAGE